MKQDEQPIEAALAASGVRVVEADRDGQWNGYRFMIDDAGAFATALKDLGVRTAFLDRYVFDEGQFLTDRDGDVTSAEGEQDLRDIVPDLRRFERHLGEFYAIEVTACLGSYIVEHFQEVPWYQDFIEMRNSAVERLGTEEEEREIGRMTRLREGQAALRAALVADEQFAALGQTTKTALAALVALARGRPEATDLPPSVVKDAVTAARNDIMLAVAKERGSRQGKR